MNPSSNAIKLTRFVVRVSDGAADLLLTSWKAAPRPFRPPEHPHSVSAAGPPRSAVDRQLTPRRWKPQSLLVLSRRCSVRSGQQNHAIDSRVANHEDGPVRVGQNLLDRSQHSRTTVLETFPAALPGCATPRICFDL